jgi:tripartite-type tricarboxylate transporter receptor subunit TctC
LSRIDLVMAANKNLKAGSIQELVALARAAPGKLTYASTGIGSSHQLYMELFKIKNGIDILHVPYKGTGQAMPDLISGQVDIMFLGSAQAISGVEGGQFKALGAGSLKRLERMPQVATIAESGNPGFAANNLWGLWAQAGTPDASIDKLRRAIAESLADPDIRKWYRDSALTMMEGGADEMMKEIREQRTRWPEVIKAANIKLLE